MVNRIADRLLNVVLPKSKVAAPCGPTYVQPCNCSRGLRYGRQCRDCTGGGGGCGPCNIVIGSC